MKVVLAFVSCLYFVSCELTPEYEKLMTEKLKEAIPKCMTDGVGIEEVSSLLATLQGGSPKAQCVVACIIKEIGGIEVDTAKREFNREVMFKFIEDVVKPFPDEYELTKKSADYCLEQVQVEDNECQSVIAFVQCASKKEEELTGKK